MDGERKRFLNYLEYEKRLSGNTLIAYESDLGQFVQFLENNYADSNLLMVTSPMIRAWMISLIEKKESATTVNRKISCLKSFYKFNLRNETIRINPTARIIRPKMPKRIPRDIATEKLVDLKDVLEVEMEENSFSHLRDYTMYMTLYLCGMRRSELIDLTWNQIDFHQRQISVIGKGKKQRLIPIDERMLKLLEDYKEALEIHQITTGDNSVFVFENGKKMYPNYVYRKMREYLSKVSTQKGIGPHTLRHSFATHMLNEGAELNAIKGLLGHSSLASTQIYTHSSIEKLKKIHQLSHPKS